MSYWTYYIPQSATVVSHASCFDGMQRANNIFGWDAEWNCAFQFIYLFIFKYKETETIFHQTEFAHLYFFFPQPFATSVFIWSLNFLNIKFVPLKSRLSAESKEKKHFLYWGQEAGILEVLPYHDCDQMSKDQPDYLTCLVRQQVQKISSRFLVFITGETWIY